MLYRWNVKKLTGYSENNVFVIHCQKKEEYDETYL